MNLSIWKIFLFTGPTLGLTVLAEIENTGFLGGPFHGVSQDATGSVVNRVGPIADLVETLDLFTHSTSRNLEDGESANLQAALRLDDGTITQLNPREVKWSTESSNLLIADGLATAKDIGERARVAVVASADGFSATIFLRLKPGQAPAETVEEIELPGALADAVDLDLPGWKKSNWFGTFYQGGNNWIHHTRHGWLFAAGGDASSAWLWSPQQEWLWTGPGIYPHLYRNKDSAWLYFIIPAFPRKVYYNYSAQPFQELTE